MDVEDAVSQRPLLTSLQAPSSAIEASIRPTIRSQHILTVTILTRIWHGPLATYPARTGSLYALSKLSLLFQVYSSMLLLFSMKALLVLEALNCGCLQRGHCGYASDGYVLVSLLRYAIIRSYERSAIHLVVQVVRALFAVLKDACASRTNMLDGTARQEYH